MNNHVDQMRKALVLASQAAKICAPSDVAYDRDISAFRIGKLGFLVQYDATNRDAPRWNVQELYEVPNTKDGGHDVRSRLIGTGGTKDIAAVAKMVVIEIVSREIEHTLDARLD